MFDSIYRTMMSGSILGLFLQVVPITCLVGVIYAAIRYTVIKKQSYAVVWSCEIIRLLFVCYLTGLINLVLVPNNLWTYIWFYLRNGYSGCEIDPLFSGCFNFVPAFLKVHTGEFTIGRWVRTMLEGNLVMFVPMGFFLPFVSRKIKIRNIWWLAVLIPCFVEILQPIIGRSFDIDDVLMNFAGIIIGYFVAIIVKVLIRKKQS